MLDGVPVALEVLAEPTRRRILDLLRTGERPVGDLVDGIGASPPAISKHPRGRGEVGAGAQPRLYRLRVEPLRELDEWLMPYRVLWADALTALEAHLDTMS